MTEPKARERAKMTINKRSKNSRLRGSHTHGWGSKKKHRGSGHRGGRGKAGSGKRADSKKPSIWHDLQYFGKHGFKPKGPALEYVSINLKTLEATLPSLVAQGVATLDNGVYSVNLLSAGYTRLLSTGKATHRMNIIIPMASPEAVSKITAAGGRVQVQAS